MYLVFVGLNQPFCLPCLIISVKSSVWNKHSAGSLFINIITIESHYFYFRHMIALQCSLQNFASALLLYSLRLFALSRLTDASHHWQKKESLNNGWAWDVCVYKIFDSKWVSYPIDSQNILTIFETPVCMEVATVLKQNLIEINNDKCIYVHCFPGWT